MRKPSTPCDASRVVVHVAESGVSESSGMGRVAFHWRAAFERAGWRFVNIGPDEVGGLRHPRWFPGKAISKFRELEIQPTAIIAHEPASGRFSQLGFPCFVESHGVERRGWELALSGRLGVMTKPNLKNRIFFPLWRLRGCDAGLRCASGLLLINSDDRDFVIDHYERAKEDIFLFRNGVHASNSVYADPGAPFTVVFNGGWLDRKGKHMLVEAAKLLKARGLDIVYHLIGTGVLEDAVRRDWPTALQANLTVTARFTPADELRLLASASVFVLPSWFEGQPLSLLQALSFGMCCITTNCCGQKDMIENNKNGILVEPGDAIALADAVALCWARPELRATLGSAARIDFQRRSWEAVSDEVVRFVESKLTDGR